jgi:uncharacterized membrane protein
MDAANGLSPAILGLIIPFLGFQHMYLALAFFAMSMAIFYHFAYGRKESIGTRGQVQCPANE